MQRNNTLSTRLLCWNFQTGKFIDLNIYHYDTDFLKKAKHETEKLSKDIIFLLKKILSETDIFIRSTFSLFFFCFLFFYRNFNIEFNFHSFLQNQFQLCLIYSNVIWWLLEQSYNVCLWGCKGDFWMLLFFLEADEKTVCVCVRARMCAYENLKNCLKYLFIRI